MKGEVSVKKSWGSIVKNGGTSYWLKNWNKKKKMKKWEKWEKKNFQDDCQAKTRERIFMEQQNLQDTKKCENNEILTVLIPFYY